MSQVGDWTPTLENLGLPALKEPNGGITIGAFVAPSWINPSNRTRSYSKAAYLDPVLSRPNLSVLVNATATRIILTNSSGTLTATGVEFANFASAPRQTVSAKREVILAAGVIGSPQLLMLSGIGPRDVLEGANISVQVELPGVGQHLQDHVVRFFHSFQSHFIILCRYVDGKRSLE
jgi:choline dehydrogenase